MEDLAPPLRCLLEVKFQLESGCSLLAALKEVAQGPPGQMNEELYDFLLSLGQGQPFQPPKSLQRRVLLQLFERGLKGEPILQALNSLEEEFIEVSKMEIEKRLSDLPLQLLVPLLFFQFPAFLLLLFGPFVFEFLKQIS